MVVVGVILFAALMNFSAVLGFGNQIISLLLPVIAGGILALFINVPMSWFEKRLNQIFANKKRRPSAKVIHILSFVLTLICVGLVLTLVLTLLIPELIRSTQSLYEQIEDKIAYISTIDFQAEWLDQLVDDFDWESMLQNAAAHAEVVVKNVVEALSSTVGIVTTTAFALIISIYMSLGKEEICRHARNLVCAYLKPGWAQSLLHFCRTFSKAFAKFLSGQCTEAVILGILMFLAFTIFKLPYGSLVGVLTAFCAIIPYVGAFISCVVSLFLTLIADPTLAIRCLIVYLVVQFIENQFIYPRVVGSSVGLSPLYTLIAALLGGKLFGILGILFFIPLAATGIELVKEDVASRLARKPVINAEG